MKALLFSLFSLLPLSFLAGTIVVQNTSDNGIGSLRQAVLDAQGGDTIRFNPNLIANGNDTIKLSSEVFIGKGLVFKGLYNSSDTLVISRSSSCRLFKADLTNSIYKNIKIDSLYLYGGSGFEGGGIHFLGGDTLIIDNSILERNYAQSDGGGVYTSSIILVNNSKLISNSASHGLGGALYSHGKVEVTNSIIDYNRGDVAGAIFGTGIRLSNSIVHRNRKGRALYSLSTMEIENSVISKNLGGGIWSNSTVILNKVTIDSNYGEGITGSGSLKGAGIYCNSSVIMDSSFVTNNIAEYDRGGGICASNVDINNSVISGNSIDLGGFKYGGGIYCSSPDLMSYISNSTISDNGHVTHGGGIFATRLEINNSIISNNKAYNGGGVYGNYGNLSTVSITNSTITNNSSGHYGGGVRANNLSLLKTTFSENVSSYGGGVYAITANIISSTFYHNSSWYQGGGINSDNLTIKNSTVTENLTRMSGAGIFSSNSTDISSCIVALNRADSILIDTGYDNIYDIDCDTIISRGNNIFSESPIGFHLQYDFINIDSSELNLLPLANYGGMTATALPSNGSLAIDIGNPNDTTSAQNRALNGVRDIGAAESCFSAVYDTVETCNNYFYRGIQYTTSGVYYDSLFNTEGCDSIGTLYLTIHSLIDTLSSIEVCSGDSILVFGTYENMSGFYYDTLYGLQGCGGDVIKVQELVVMPSYIDTLIPLTICNNDSVLIFGGYKKLSGTYRDSYISINGCDSLFVQELIVESNTQDTLPITILCPDDSLLVFERYIYAGGTYIDSLSDVNGCDSIIVQKVIMDSIDVTISISNSMVLSNYIGGTYQWIDCGNGGLEIVDETSRLLNTSQVSGSGIYAVIVTTQDCSDTSVCISVNGVDIADYDNLELISIYPNPNDGRFIVGLNSEVKEGTSLFIYNITGELLKEEHLLFRKTTIDINEFSRGVYFAQIVEKGIEKGRTKIVKQ